MNQLLSSGLRFHFLGFYEDGLGIHPASMIMQMMVIYKPTKTYPNTLNAHLLLKRSLGITYHERFVK